MKVKILLIIIVLSMFFIPVGSALDVPVTSYWVYVTENGIPTSGAVVTVHDAAGNEITTTTSLGGSDMGLYQVNVNWDDLTTIDVDEGVIGGENITFKIDGKTVNSRVIAELGSNNRLDLDVTTTSDDTWTPTPTTKTSSVPLTVGWNLVALTGTPANTSTASVMSSVTDNITVVWGYNKSALQAWEIYDPAMPSELNSIKNMVLGRGYWIYAKVDVEWIA